MENLLEIKKLNAWYSENTPIIKELSMTIEKNTVIGLLGLNGAGKTTLINTLCGLHNGMKIDTALFNGKEISFRDNNFKKNRYVVFSEDDSLEYFTFDEYISYVGKTTKRKNECRNIWICLKSALSFRGWSGMTSTKSLRI